jgi:arginine exporter protein ArgO
MTSQALPTRRQAILLCLFAALTALMCGGLLGAAALVPAPPAVLPFFVAIGIVCPMAAAWELPAAIAGLRSASHGEFGRGPVADAEALATLRRQLDELPETQHPLDL